MVFFLGNNIDIRRYQFPERFFKIMGGLRIGMDGCPAGWLCIASVPSHKWEARIFSTLKEAWNNYKKSNPELILIDIPIGFMEEGPEPRVCDRLAREYLTRARASSIFPVPCRAAIYAESYEEASKINKMKTSNGISKQSWNITPKMREMDELLQADTAAQKIFIESMPEICFTALNEDKPMRFYKKFKEGIRERLEVLETKGKMDKSLFLNIKNQFKATHVKDDDILDALVLSVSASGGISKLGFLPALQELDVTGLPMRIAYPIV